MKKERNTAELFDGNEAFDDIELLEDDNQVRTLILKAEPRSRRLQLMAQGAKEIRCFYCNQIKPLAGAEECEEGWYCEDCASEIVQKLQCHANLKCGLSSG